MAALTACRSDFDLMGANSRVLRLRIVHTTEQGEASAFQDIALPYSEWAVSIPHGWSLEVDGYVTVVWSKI